MARKKTKKRILHVEDDKNWRSTVQDLLSDQYSVASFNNLPAAKEAAAAQEFDYFICDTQIHGEDGSEWAEELQRQGKKVMSLATDTRKGIPLLSKAGFSKTNLLKMLKSL